MFILIAGATFVAGWAAGYLATRQLVKQELNQVRSRIDELEARPTASPSAAATVAVTPEPARPAAAATAPQAAAQPPVSPARAPEIEEGITPEILMVISAAVAAFLGKKARVRRARQLPYPGVSPWAQQGRVFIQASHNLNR
jgi:methylmalonyl-CoA carboxyltransferase 12S subunit